MDLQQCVDSKHLSRVCTNKPNSRNHNRHESLKVKAAGTQRLQYITFSQYNAVQVIMVSQRGGVTSVRAPHSQGDTALRCHTAVLQLVWLMTPPTNVRTADGP